MSTHTVTLTASIGWSWDPSARQVGLSIEVPVHDEPGVIVEGLLVHEGTGRTVYLAPVQDTCLRGKYGTEASALHAMQGLVERSQILWHDGLLWGANTSYLLPAACSVLPDPASYPQHLQSTVKQAITAEQLASTYERQGHQELVAERRLSSIEARIKLVQHRLLTPVS